MLALRMHCLHKDYSRVYFVLFLLYQPYFLIGRRSSESKTFVAMGRHAQRPWRIPVGKYTISIIQRKPSGPGAHPFGPGAHPFGPGAHPIVRWGPPHCALGPAPLGPGARPVGPWGPSHLNPGTNAVGS